MIKFPDTFWVNFCVWCEISVYFLFLSFLFFLHVSWVSVVQSCPTLCDPMDCSTQGFPVHHQLLELAQTNVSWVSTGSSPGGRSFLPAGWRWGCRVWMSMGKWSLLRMISWFLPVNLLALLMLLVCQSVQYKLSSNTVMAKGCGRPGESPGGPQSTHGLPGS